VTDSTARKKVPLPPGYVVPRPQQPPPMRRRDSKSVTGVEVVASAAPAPTPAAPVVVSAPAPVRAKAVVDERALQAAAYREAMATISEDEDKTTAFQVPEELLRRARTGVPAPAVDEEKGPDSGAITAPPPASPTDEAALEEPIELKIGVPGVPRNLDVHSFADVGLESGDDSVDEEHSGEFTRINTAGELEILATMIEQESTKTKTVVRKRLEQKAPERGGVTAVAVLWMVIGALSAAGAVLASLMANG
jgi:hypothetical protein